MSLAAPEVYVSGTPFHDLRCENSDAKNWFLFVSCSAWLNELILIGIYLFNVNNAIRFINWPLTELIHCVIWAGLYPIAAIVELAVFHECSLYVVAGVFGFLMTAIYAASTFMAFKQWRSIRG